MSEQPIITDERGHERHPAFGTVNVNRVSATPGGVLFDSDLKHQHYVTLTINTASRQRVHGHDYIHPERHLIEIAMSEAQWAQLVSSVNGLSTPVTLSYIAGEGSVPEIPYEPRLGVSQAEVRSAAHEAFAKAKEALDAYEAHKTVANLRHLRAVLANAEGNIEFVAETLSRHAENVSTKARADIEAMINAAASNEGIVPLSAAAMMPETTELEK